MSDLGLTGLTKPDSGSDLSERVSAGQPRSESREPLRPLRLRTPKHTRQWREFALLWDAQTLAERMRADAMFSMARVKVATHFVHWARHWKRSRIQNLRSAMAGARFRQNTSAIWVLPKFEQLDLRPK